MHSVNIPSCYLEGRGLSKSFISRVLIGVSAFRVLINSTYNLLTKSPAPQVADHQEASATSAV